MTPVKLVPVIVTIVSPKDDPLLGETLVNGPGEAREADLGVASGNGKGQIFVKGKVVATVPESKIVETLIDEAMRLAEQALEDGAQEAPGQPIVTVS